MKEEVDFYVNAWKCFCGMLEHVQVKVIEREQIYFILSLHVTQSKLSGIYAFCILTELASSGFAILGFPNLEFWSHF